MTPKMKDWAERDEVAAVIVTGEGDKAFCAGGDVQALYHAATENLAVGHTVTPSDFLLRSIALTISCTATRNPCSPWATVL